MQDHSTDQVEKSPQAQFVKDVTNLNLFAVGSMIIAFNCMSLSEQWRVDSYIINLPADCLSWKQSARGSKDFPIYKYTKILEEQPSSIRRKSRRQLQKERLNFVDYFGEHLI